jgi:hypothetical protein
MNEIQIGQGLGLITKLVRVFNLQNVHVPDSRTSRYPQLSLKSTPDLTRPSKMAGMNGIPTFVDLVLQGGTYDTNTKKGISYPTITFEAVIMTIEKSARIVKTEIQGRDGTVKEYIGKDDAKITIQGVITGDNGVYPATAVNALVQWWEAPVTKTIVCPFAQNLGITNIVCEDISIPQVSGGYSYQQFTMNCISDIEVNLIIK